MSKEKDETMSIELRYYTRGGNTQKLAQAVEEVVGVQAKTVSEPLTERVDILLLGCSYYAFDMDDAVKKFTIENKDKIGKIVLFGTSAMIKSIKKPLKNVLKGLNVDIEIADEEFHCPGEFGLMHKGRPNANDVADVKEFAKQTIKKVG